MLEIYLKDQARLVQVKKKKRISKPKKIGKMFHFERPYKLSEGIKTNLLLGGLSSRRLSGSGGLLLSSFWRHF